MSWAAISKYYLGILEHTTRLTPKQECFLVLFSLPTSFTASLFLERVTGISLQWVGLVYTAQAGLGPLNQARQTHVQETPPVLTPQGFKQKCFMSTAGAADRQQPPNNTSEKVLAGGTPCTINYENKKRHQVKNFYPSHFIVTSAAVNTAHMVFIFQAAETQKQP